MLFSSRFRPLAGSLAVALFAGCEPAPTPDPDPGPDPDVACDAAFPSAPDGAGEIVYVAAQCIEAQADGTKAHPFVRVADALAHAGDGATILVSAGEYKENLTLTRPATIVGSSDPANPESATLSLQAADDDAIRVVDTDAVLIGVRIQGAQGTGVRLEGGSVRIEGSVIEDTQPGRDGEPGVGVAALQSGTLTLLRSRVSGTSGTGVLVAEASATITESEVRDSGGYGIVLDRTVNEAHISDTTVSGSVGTGIRAVSSSVLIDRSTVSGTLEDEFETADGILSYEAYDAQGEPLGPAGVTVRDSVLSGNGRTGILCADGTDTVVLQGNTVSDNGLLGTSVFEYVAGVWLQNDVAADPASEIRDNTISGNNLAGIFLIGDTHGILVQENTVSGTLLDDLYWDTAGDGISLSYGASAQLSGNIVTGSARIGIMVNMASEVGTEITNNTIENGADWGIVLQEQPALVVIGNTFSGNASGDMTSVPAGTYASPDRPMDL